MQYSKTDFQFPLLGLICGCLNVIDLLIESSQSIVPIAFLTGQFSSEWPS